MSTRRQLTLFVETCQANVLEAIRHKYNPVQYGLISAHVTLCRADEIQDTTAILNTLKYLVHPPIRLSFGTVATFSDGTGVWLPDRGDNLAFHALRAKILRGKVLEQGKTQPHLTLMHPRNSTCNPTLFKEISSYNLPSELTFDKVSLIEQTDGRAWQILQTFPMVAANN